MGIKRDIPQITALREQVELRMGKALVVHADFLMLAGEIMAQQREHISESTLERVWGYSTRGYSTISLRTLNVLSYYACECDWLEFCQKLRNRDGGESDLFDVEYISTVELNVGDRLQIGWLPDRQCTVRYLGEHRFVAEECLNSKMQSGDTFMCLQFTLGKELMLCDFQPVGASQQSKSRTYVVGSVNGITSLRRIE